ncbi:Las17-binding protein actin regulator [Nitzschia inconspicua]|uniref:Las17-binding protein actin regulator n=1 Tax=Nitzschia inconspicua TaxID=303405 RepID=A0A9K3PHD2_9STRA|nr:Las17-binding protein actin regulator [Nitzschia inconspicua]
MTEEKTTQEEHLKDDGIGKIRPSRLSMEGYIYNANRVLEACLDPKTKQVPTELVEKCKGVAIITMIQVGALVSLQYGTGLIMKKTESGWSAPSSVSVGGTSFGAVLGGKRDNFIIFIMDDENMEDFASRPQSRISLDASVAAGTVGLKGNVGNEAPKKGTVTFVLSEGVFVGFSVEMFTLEFANRQNEIFYGKKGLKAKDILFKDGAVTIPDNSQLSDVQRKMEMLSRGETWIPSDDDVNRSRHFASEALLKASQFASGKLDGSESGQ